MDGHRIDSKGGVKMDDNCMMQEPMSLVYSLVPRLSRCLSASGKPEDKAMSLSCRLQYMAGLKGNTNVLHLV